MNIPKCLMKPSPLKSFLAGTFDAVTAAIMWVPCYAARRLWLRLITRGVGSGTFVMRRVEFSSPRNVRIGCNCVVNKRVLLDGRGGQLVIGNNVDIARDAIIWTLTHDPHDDYHKVKNGGGASV